MHSGCELQLMVPSMVYVTIMRWIGSAIGSCSGLSRRSHNDRSMITETFGGDCKYVTRKYGITAIKKKTTRKPQHHFCDKANRIFFLKLVSLSLKTNAALLLSKNDNLNQWALDFRGTPFSLNLRINLCKFLSDVHIFATIKVEDHRDLSRIFEASRRFVVIGESFCTRQTINVIAGNGASRYRRCALGLLRSPLFEG